MLQQGAVVPNTNPCDVFDPTDTGPVGYQPTQKLVNGICTDTGPNTYVCDCAPDAHICADGNYTSNLPLPAIDCLDL